MKLLRRLRVDLVVLVLALVAAAVYGGGQAVGVAVILVAVEVTFSFDNATVNARILERMSLRWRRLFLTVGMVVAVLGMRLVFPLLIVAVTAGIAPWSAVRLALDKGDVHRPGTYGYLLHQAHPLIAAFGAVFLLMLAVDFLTTRRDVQWLGPVERTLARAGRLPGVSVAVAGGVLALVATVLTTDDHVSRQVLLAGVLGVVAYVLVNGLGSLVPSPSPASTGGDPAGGGAHRGLVLFVYLEVIDATFSFDAVIGAFAITPDPVVIALGLGVGALLVRSLTVYLVDERALGRLPYLEHGAHWAILALALILAASVRFELPEVVTGLVGVAILAAAVVSSLVARRRSPAGVG